MKPWSMAVKAVMIDEAGRCLMVRRSAANTSFVGCWEWPGGKVDPGEDFATAVVRETMEETSLAVEIIGLAGAAEFEMPKVHVVLLCMEARITGGEIELSHEHDDWAWVPLAEIGDRKLSESVRRFMLDYAARKMRQPGFRKG